MTNENGKEPQETEVSKGGKVELYLADRDKEILEFGIYSMDQVTKRAAEYLIADLPLIPEVMGATVAAIINAKYPTTIVIPSRGGAPMKVFEKPIDVLKDQPNTFLKDTQVLYRLGIKVELNAEGEKDWNKYDVEKTKIYGILSHEPGVECVLDEKGKYPVWTYKYNPAKDVMKEKEAEKGG